jgi:hypothetical protein
MNGYLMTLEGNELGFNPIKAVKKAVKKTVNSAVSVVNKIPIPSIPTPAQIINNPLTRAALPDSVVKSVAKAVNDIPGVSVINTAIAKTNNLKEYVTEKIVDTAEIIKDQALNNPEIMGIIIGTVTMNPAIGTSVAAGLKAAGDAVAVYNKVSDLIPDGQKEIVKQIINNPSSINTVIDTITDGNIQDKLISIVDDITVKAVSMAEKTPEISAMVQSINKAESDIAAEKIVVKETIKPIVAPYESGLNPMYIVGGGLALAALLTLRKK